MNKNPLVSIVIPVYNGSNYLAEAIDSAINQTYKNTEIIVVNDGSCDDGETERIAKEYGEKIKYIYKENGGSSSALNAGIANMNGAWFSWLSHDDLYRPDKLERQIEYMRSLNIDDMELSQHIFFSASELIDAQGKVIRRFNLKKARAMQDKVERISDNKYLIAEPTTYSFNGCSCLINGESFIKAGMFNENLRLLNDVDMWFRLYVRGFKVHYIPEPLVKGRIHSKQISKSIGFSYHNSEQDMFWKRSLEWLTTNFPKEEELFFLYGRNAYLKTRNVEGDLAFNYTNISKVKKNIFRLKYKSRAFFMNFVKSMYLKIKT